MRMAIVDYDIASCLAEIDGMDLFKWPGFADVQKAVKGYAAAVDVKGMLGRREPGAQ